MSDEDAQQYPNRPNHPDFWVLANTVSAMDDAAESVGPGQFDFEGLVGEYVDPESLAYVAIQRAMRAFGVVTQSDLQENQALVQRGAALYHEAFLLGAGYQQEKDAKSDD